MTQRLILANPLSSQGNVDLQDEHQSCVGFSLPKDSHVPLIIIIFVVIIIILLIIINYFCCYRVLFLLYNTSSFKFVFCFV